MNKEPKRLVPSLFSLHAVAFLDVLGFTSLIGAATRAQGKTATKPESKTDFVEAHDALDRVLDYVEESAKIVEKIRDDKGGDGVDLVTFSDSIAISAPVRGTDLVDRSRALRQVLASVARIQTHLCRKNIWLRGAVTMGPLYRKGAQIVGQGLVDAYGIESTSAIWPRVIIDPTIMKPYVASTGGINSFITDMNNNTYGQDLVFDAQEHWVSMSRYQDGLMFVDYLMPLMGKSESTDELRRTLNFVRDNYYSKPDIFEKHAWVVDYLRSHVFVKFGKKSGMYDEGKIDVIKDWLGEEGAVHFPRGGGMEF